jgi:IclR family transcriptional regulator, KDG regulon repressor
MQAITISAEPFANTNRYAISSVRSAFDVLFAFLQLGTEDGRLGVTELARFCGQTKNQTFRLLQTMVEAGVIIRNDDDRTYSLGYRLLELGAAAQSRSNLVHAAQATIDRLARESGKLVTLGTLSSDFATMLLDGRHGAHVPPDQELVLGKRFALHAGAGSKLLLAYSSQDYFDEYIRVASPLKRFTPYTCVQPSLLRQECEQIRSNGYAMSFQDLDLQRCSMALPILDARDDVIGGIGLISQPQEFGEEDRRRYLALLRAGSEEISARLGRRA